MSVVASYFMCGSCGKEHKWKAELAGRKAQCKCGQRLLIPHEEDFSDGIPIAASAGEAAPAKVEPAPIPEEADSPDDIYGMTEDEPKKASPLSAALASAKSSAAQPARSSAPAAAPTRTRTLAYATPKHDGPVLLGDADIDWVMKLRNAARLMCMALSLNFLIRVFLPSTLMIDTMAQILNAAINLAAAWLLTEPEPGTATKLLSSRVLLRITAFVAGAGQLLAAIGGLQESSTLLVLGGAIYLMTVPSTFLFLWYLRKLALRLPSTPLAVNCAIVMVALPGLLSLTLTGGLLAAQSRSAGMMIATGLLALVGLAVLRVWYIVLLIWFNRSFS